MQEEEEKRFRAKVKGFMLLRPFIAISIKLKRHRPTVILIKEFEAIIGTEISYRLQFASLTKRNDEIIVIVDHPTLISAVKRQCLLPIETENLIISDKCDFNKSIEELAKSEESYRKRKESKEQTVIQEEYNPKLEYQDWEPKVGERVWLSNGERWHGMYFIKSRHINGIKVYYGTQQKGSIVMEVPYKVCVPFEKIPW